MDIPVKETTLSGWLVPTNPDRGSNGSGVLTQDQNSLEKMEEGHWGNHFWASGYCVDTVGLDTEMIRKYIKYQEKKERESEKPKY